MPPATGIVKYDNDIKGLSRPRTAKATNAILSLRCGALARQLARYLSTDSSAGRRDVDRMDHVRVLKQ